MLFRSCGGSFEGIHEIIKKRLGQRRIGFTADASHGRREIEVARLLEQITPEDVLEFGLIPELVGRLPILCPLMPLDRDAMVNILTEPRNALVKQYGKLLGMEDVALEITPDALHELAAQAIKKGTGARALRGLLERLMLDVMYDIPGADDVEAVKLTAAVVRGESAPLVQRKIGRAHV